jgi:hypothetical protein
MEPLRTAHRDYSIDRSRANARREPGSLISSRFVPIVTRVESSPHSHWRRLGELLVSAGLVQKADLEYALAVQRQAGGLLGEILVDRGFVSASDVWQALVGQHGVTVNLSAELRERRLRVPQAPSRGDVDRWKPLGRLLVDKGLLSESGLERALVDQLRTGRLLGEILVSRGWVSAEDVARAVAEQHGVELETEVDAEASPSAQKSEKFEVYMDGADLVHASPTFLDAADLAFELIEQKDPETAEIVRVADGGHERVWFYSRRLADAEAKRKTPLDRYGYPVNDWNAGRPREHPRGSPV